MTTTTKQSAGATVVGGLRGTLIGLLQRAADAPGRPVRQVLPRRLRVDVKIEYGTTRLQISRTGQYPSDDEWLTVLKYWPYPVNAQASRLEFGGRCYLRASWPTPKGS
jgi:hypothetical protein